MNEKYENDIEEAKSAFSYFLNLVPKNMKADKKWLIKIMDQEIKKLENR